MLCGMMISFWVNQKQVRRHLHIERHLFCTGTTIFSNTIWQNFWIFQVLNCGDIICSSEIYARINFQVIHSFNKYSTIFTAFFAFLIWSITFNKIIYWIWFFKKLPGWTPFPNSLIEYYMIWFWFVEASEDICKVISTGSKNSLQIKKTMGNKGIKSQRCI